MIELRRILLIDWYLFRVEQIDIKGMTGLIGPNGAGKSAVIDAMQTVLTGASMSSIRFNASAQTNSKSKRSIRDYCLGVVSLDEKGERSEPSRTHVYTYIVLGFLNKETGEELNLGIAFSANSARAEEVCEAQFIVRGGLIGSNDLLEPVDGGEVETRQWHAVKSLLRARGLAVEDGYGSATDFVEEALRVLSPPGYPLDPRRFLRSFRNALMLKPVDNPTEFIRNYILDVQPIKIDRLRQSIALYRSLADRIENLKAQSTSLGQVLGIVARLNDNERRIRLTEWEITRLRWEEFRREIREIQDQLKTLEAEMGNKERHAVLAETRYYRLGIEISKIELTLNSSESVQLARQYEAEREAEKIKKINAAAPFTSLQDLIGKMNVLVEKGILSTHEEELQTQLLSFVNESAHLNLNQWAYRLPEGWENDASHIDYALSAIRMEQLNSIQEQLDKDFIAFKMEAQKLQQKIEDINANLKRLQEGRSVIGDGTRALISALQSENILAEPLCDLVEVTDKKWREAAEAALGKSREALIVDPKHASQASSLFRAGKDDSFSQAEIVNTTKTENTRPADAGSLAQIISTQDRHARAFIDFRLGRLQMVEDTDRLLAAESAITPDRMMNAARSVKRLSHPGIMRLGRASSAEARKTLEEERANIQSQLAHMTITALNLQANKNIFDDVVRMLAKIRTDGLACITVGATISAHDKRILELDENIKDAERKQDPHLLKELDRLKADAASAKTEKSKADKELESTRRKLDETRGVYNRLHKNDLPLHSGKRRKAAHMLFGHGHSEDAIQFHMFARKEPAESLKTHIAEREKEFQHRMTDRRPRLDRELNHALTKHCQEFHATLPFSGGDTDTQTIGSWAESEKQRLDTHELIKYEHQCRNAQNEMTTAFRDDLLHRLHDAFEGIKETLGDLNRHLKDRQFHGRDYYSFKSAQTASHADLIELVSDSRRPDFDLPLFSDQTNNSADTATGRAIQVIEHILRDPHAKTEDIEDARQYFTYELYIHDAEGKIRSSLSSRTGTGSGGEGQLPFYIAIGASLAATYLNRRSNQMGLGLAVFDEAFNRLDTKAIGACAAFLQDLGLQIVLAAPDEKRHVFMEVVDTVVNVNRVGDHAYITTEYLTEKTRQILTETDPYRKGFSEFKEALMESEARTNTQQDAAE